MLRVFKNGDGGGGGGKKTIISSVKVKNPKYCGHLIEKNI